MERFEELLRRALMDANLEQYEPVLRRAESEEPDFSPRYRRERTRLLSDPWGWMRRGRRRVDWRLIAAIAALLLLSACAYAVFTGQFTNWFPALGIDAKKPEASEDVMARMGTVIEQTQTSDGAALTLNGAVWDGKMLLLSLTAEDEGLPEGLSPDARLYYDECRLELAEEQKETYVRRDAERFLEGAALEQIEEEVQFNLSIGEPSFYPLVQVVRREKDTVQFQITAPLDDHLERPEFTLHIENLALCGEEMETAAFNTDGQRSGPETVILRGPYDFHFALEKCIPPVTYTGTIDFTYEGIPMQITRMDLSALQMWVDFQVLVPVDIGRDPNERTITAAQEREMGPQGFWTEDGAYVDFSGCMGNSSMVSNEQGAELTIGRTYPYVADPARITAVNIGGTRIELRELELQNRDE